MATPLYVDPAAADDSGDGTTPATAKKTIDAAYNAVDDGGSVYLLAGTYDATTQGASWYVAFDVNKSVTIKPDPATSPTIVLAPAPALASLNFSAGAAGTKHRIEGVTITPTAGSRIATFGASFFGDAEIVDCVLNAGSRDISCSASAAATRTLLMSGCYYATSSMYHFPMTDFAAISIVGNVLVSTSTSTSSNEAVVRIAANCGHVRIQGNTITCGNQCIIAYLNATWDSFTIDGNSINWTPNASFTCIYFRDDAAGTRENITITDNTINVSHTLLSPYVIRIGFSNEVSGATEYPSPVIVGNRITRATPEGYTYGITLSAPVSDAFCAYNEVVNCSHGIRCNGAWGSHIDSNYINGGDVCLLLDGGGKHRITHNHIITSDYGESNPGRTILFNRLVKAESTTTTTFTATTVTDAGGTPWGGDQALVAAGLIAMVNEGTTWWSPLQWGRVVSIDGNEITVDAWYKFDGIGDTETPTNGHVCRIIEFPSNCVVTDNVMDAGSAEYGFTFDFIPVDPECFMDRNIYRSGTNVLTNLGSHLTAGSPESLAELQAVWAEMSESHPYNDANSQEIFYPTQKYIQSTRWWRMPGWQSRINRRGLLLPI